MIMVYTAGPFSAPDRAAVEGNIAAMVQLAIEVARRGAFPVCPHANTAHPEFEKVQPYTFWIEGTMALMRACDAVILAPNWQASSGACGERAEALRLEMPVFETLEQLDEWLLECDLA